MKPEDLSLFENLLYVDASANSLSLGKKPSSSPLVCSHLSNLKLLLVSLFFTPADSFSSLVSLRQLNLTLNGLCNMSFNADDFPHLQVRRRPLTIFASLTDYWRNNLVITAWINSCSTCKHFSSATREELHQSRFNRLGMCVNCAGSGLVLQQCVCGQHHLRWWNPSSEGSSSDWKSAPSSPSWSWFFPQRRLSTVRGPFRRGFFHSVFWLEPVSSAGLLVLPGGMWETVVLTPASYEWNMSGTLCILSTGRRRNMLFSVFSTKYFRGHAVQHTTSALVPLQAVCIHCYSPWIRMVCNVLQGITMHLLM